MRSCSQAVQLEDEDLAEFTHVFVANVAKVMGENFAAYVPDLVPYLLDAANRSDISHGLAQEDNFAGQHNRHFCCVLNRCSVTHSRLFVCLFFATVLGAGIADENDDDDEYAYIDIRPTFVNFKRSAITAIGALARNTGTAFQPFLEQALQVVATQYSAFHQVVRAEVRFFVSTG